MLNPTISLSLWCATTEVNIRYSILQLLKLSLEIFGYFTEQRRLRDDEYPLETRVVLGPHETVARLFLVDRFSTPEISSDVAQFLNLSAAECSGILQRYHYEEERQIAVLKEKFVSFFSLNLLYRIDQIIFTTFIIILDTRR